MKRILTMIIIGHHLTLIFSQTLIDSALYNKGLAMISSSQSSEEFLKVADYFHHLSSQQKNEWLAPLYCGLCYILASFNESETKQKDQLCNEAQLFLDTANFRHADVSELAAVQAFLYQARIDVNPLERGLEYSQKADIEIRRAETANPTDPRPYFLYAMNVFYTPKVFGGGPEKALPLFEEAAEKFDAFVPRFPFMPHWGKQQNQDMITRCRMETKSD
jgi:hypothetical protein